MAPKVTDDGTGWTEAIDSRTSNSFLWWEQRSRNIEEKPDDSNGLKQRFDGASKVPIRTVHLKKIKNKSKKEDMTVTEVEQHDMTSTMKQRDISSAGNKARMFWLRMSSIGVIVTMVIMLVFLMITVQNKNNRITRLQSDLAYVKNIADNQLESLEELAEKAKGIEKQNDELLRQVSTQQALLLLNIDNQQALEDILHTTQEQLAEKQSMLDWTLQQWQSSKAAYIQDIAQKYVQNKQASKEIGALNKMLFYSVLVPTLLSSTVPVPTIRTKSQAQIGSIMKDLVAFFLMKKDLYHSEDDNSVDDKDLWISWILNSLCQNREFRSTIIENGGLKVLTSIIESYSPHNDDSDEDYFDILDGYTDNRIFTDSKWKHKLIVTKAQESMELLFTRRRKSSTSNDQSDSDNQVAIVPIESKNVVISSFSLGSLISSALNGLYHVFCWFVPFLC